MARSKRAVPAKAALVMRRISTTLLITLSLVSVVISAVFVANAIGLFPDSQEELVRGRIALCEAIGLQCSQAVDRRDRKMIEETFDQLVKRNHDILAVRLRKKDGKIYASAGVESGFQSEKADIADIPIVANATDWGTIQVAFGRKAPFQLWDIVTAPVTQFAIVLGAICGIIFQIYLRRILQHLDPTRVVPQRVRTTLDTLAEGLVVLDREHRIVLANQSFADLMCCDAEELQGIDVADFEWKIPNTGAAAHRLPWVEAIAEQRVVAGAVLQLDLPNLRSRKFRVSCSPIKNHGRDCDGALVSFDDVTALEARTVELTSMLEKLKQSRDKIRLQNQQLLTLATRDPLTGAFNRRSLFEHLDRYWAASKRSGQSICCIMVDIDHFKTINDTHGHAMGDLVLKQTVQLFQRLTPSDDLVARFGGEEFCIIMANVSLEQAIEHANTLRATMEATDFSGVSVTSSFGVAEMTAETKTPAELIDCADRSLYVAKRTGRNRVISFPELARIEEIEITDGQTTGNRFEPIAPESAIPFQTVAALTAALAYRDVATAQHSRRVADNCFRLGSSLMTISESYILENAALLHDIGKIGVPDSILLKPGALTFEEWEVMRTHDEIGVEIIRSTFACEQLNNIVEYHHARYSGTEGEPDFPKGGDIPLGARILTIADSYDAMVSDRVYRKGLSQEEAFAELRRCAGTQFDPKLVERFIEMVEHQNDGEVCQAENSVAYVDKQTALRLGVQIEDLAQALDTKDRERLAFIANAISDTANQYQVPEVAKLAEALKQSVTCDDQWVENLGLTIELMELCRLTQQSHLNVVSLSENSGASEPETGLLMPTRDG